VIRVLVVDDDFMVATVHSRFVEQAAGFAVVGVAHTGAEALAQVEQLRPDLVLLDIYLPDMSGLAVLQRLRGSGTPEVDVLVVSAARDVDSIKQALRGGVAHYLVKPFDQAALQERLERYAEQRRRLSALTEACQEDVDRVFGSLRLSAGRTTMPKGLTAETEQLVREALSIAGPEGLSASECGSRTGLSRVSARRYLEHLAAMGHAEVRSRYGTSGRPERRFHWTG
jgi:response regulator of citrate/malate metabolism